MNCLENIGFPGWYWVLTGLSYYDRLFLKFFFSAIIMLKHDSVKSYATLNNKDIFFQKILKFTECFRICWFTKTFLRQKCCFIQIFSFCLNADAWKCMLSPKSTVCSGTGIVILWNRDCGTEYRICSANYTYLKCIFRADLNSRVLNSRT